MQEQKIINWLYFLFFLLLPILFIPPNSFSLYTSELFEFNKTILVFFIASWITTFWLIASIKTKKIIWQTTKITWLWLFFLASQLISTVFSSDMQLSLWGYYSRFHQSLFHSLAYFILYQGFITWINKQQTKTILKGLTVSSGLVALYAIAQHFGIDAKYWLQDVQNRAFASLGQPNWLATFDVLIVYLLMDYWLNKAKSIKIPLVIYAIGSLVLLLTKSRSGYLAYFAGLVLYLGWHRYKKENSHLKPSFYIKTILIASITTLLFFYPNLSKYKQQHINRTNSEQVSRNISKAKPILITPSSEIRKIVWLGAIKLWQLNPKNFLIGTGVETFAFNYYKTRPARHNLTSEWDFIYNKAHNEYLNMLVTTGLFGLIAYISLFVGILISLVANSSFLTAGGLAGITGFLIAVFFGFSTTSTFPLAILIPAINSQVKTTSPPFVTPKNISPFTYLLISIILLAGLWLSSFWLKWWLADISFAKANKLSTHGDYHSAILAYQKAAKLNSHQPVYSIKLANALALQLATYLSANQEKINDPQTQSVISYINSLVNYANQASPTNLEFQKKTAKIYILLSTAIPKYYPKAIKTIEKLKQLAPTDPSLAYNLGLIYQLKDLDNQAEKEFLEAINLKPNYDAVYVKLLELYAKKKDKVNYQKYLKLWQKNNPNSPSLLKTLSQTNQGPN